MPGRKKKFDRASCLACAGKTEEDRLILELRAIHRTMNALYEGKGSWKRVLIVLGRTGPITQKALTNRLGIQPGSVSAVLGKMEAMGLITRTPSAADQRTMDLRTAESVALQSIPRGRKPGRPGRRSARRPPPGNVRLPFLRGQNRSAAPAGNAERRLGRAVCRKIEIHTET